MTDYDRSEITFEQAEGLEPLPTQMALKTLSTPLRARLFSLLANHIASGTPKDLFDNYEQIGYDWRHTYGDYLIGKGTFPTDIDYGFSAVLATLDRVFRKGSYSAVLGFVEFCVRHYPDDYQRRLLATGVADILEANRCAYRLVEGSIIPLATDEEKDSVIAAFAALENGGLRGAKQHLQQAGSNLTAGNCSGSIRESIHAVESVARTLTGSTSLREALDLLSRRHPMHPALKEGFNRIYGYTSDEKGIRHAMLGADAPNVGEPEALFMLGACASFVTYLTLISKEQAS
jgi:hypothetical protein